MTIMTSTIGLGALAGVNDPAAVAWLDQQAASLVCDVDARSENADGVGRHLFVSVRHRPRATVEHPRSMVELIEDHHAARVCVRCAPLRQSEWVDTSKPYPIR